MWKKCRDVIEGEDTIKAAGSVYLPMLEEQLAEDYDAYRKRAVFFGATDRTVKGLVGAALRKEPKTTVPPSFEDLLKTIGPNDESIVEVSRRVLEETIGMGRVGVLVDAPTGNQSGIPYLSIYTAESVINWKSNRKKGYDELEWVVIREDADVDTDDPFEPKCEIRYRLLYLENDTYKVRILQIKENLMTSGMVRVPVILEDFTPRSRGGRTFDQIPFVFINATSGIGTTCDKSPVLDLVNINLSHYRTSADLEHGRHFTALPTAWVSGFDPKETKLKIGSSTAWVSQNESAHAGFLEFTGAGLRHLADALSEKKNEMAILGARLLEEQKASAEAAETLKLRHSGERSALTTICRSVSQGLTQALKWAVIWAGYDEAEVAHHLNEDFGTSGVTPAVLATMLSAFQSGSYSYDSWFWFLKTSDLLPEDRTQDDELTFLQKGSPMGSMNQSEPPITSAPPEI